MTPTPRRMARASTSERPIRVDEATTRQRTELFRDFDRDYPTKSMPSICSCTILNYCITFSILTVLNRSLLTLYIRIIYTVNYLRY